MALVSSYQRHIMHFIGKFSEKTVSFVSGATLLGVAVSLFVLPHTTHAQSLPDGTQSIGNYSIASDCVGTFQFSNNLSDSMSVQTAYARFYGGTYPATTTHLGGTSGYASTYGAFHDGAGGATTSDYIIEMTNLSSQVSDVAGDYYLYFSDDRESFYAPYEVLSADVCTPRTGLFLPSSTSTFDFWSDHNTRFTDLTYSASSSILFRADYYLDPNEYNTNQSAYNPTHVRFSYATSGSPTRISIDMTDFVEDGYVTYLMSMLPDGDYDMFVDFSNVGCTIGMSECPFPNTGAYTQFTISGGALTSSTTASLQNLTDNNGDSKYYPCSLTQLTGCIKNFGVFLFQPTDFSTEYWSNTQDYVETKVPFIYAYQYADSINNINSNASGDIPTVEIYSDSLGTTTILSSDFFDSEPLATVAPILVTATGAGFYLVLGYYLYARTRRFTEKLTSS